MFASLLSRFHRLFDSAFDRQYGVETTALINISDIDGHDNLFANYDIDELYSGTPTLLFKDVHAPIINMDKDKVTYIDVGCGKGRVLIQALDAGFKNLIGVEFVPDIAAQSRDNMALAIGKLNDDTQKSINCQIISQDIRQYKYPNTPLILYLFNPFDPIIFQAFMDNLLKDLAENPRPMTLIYSNAHCQDILDACQELQRLEYSSLPRLKLKCLSSHSYGAWQYIL